MESDAAAITESPSFGQLVGQLLGIGQQIPGAAEETGYLSDAGVINRQGIEIPITTGPQDIKRTLTDSSQDLLNALPAEVEPKDGVKEQEISRTHVNGADGNKAFTLEMPREKMPPGKASDSDYGELDKGLFGLSALVDEQESELFEAAEILDEQRQAGPHSGAEKNASSQTVDYPSFVHHESSAFQHQTVYAEVKGSASAETAQHVRTHAMDRDELFSNTVSIIKEGTRLAVKLEPDGLGKLDINLDLKNGLVHAQINVHDDATKTLIDNNMHQIVDALLKEGLSVGGFSVSLHKGDVWGQSAEFDYSDQAGITVDSSTGAIEVTQATASRLVNIFV